MQEKIEYRVVDTLGAHVFYISGGQAPYEIQTRKYKTTEWEAISDRESEPEPEDIDYGRTPPPSWSPGNATPYVWIENTPYDDAINLIIARANLWARMNSVPEGELVALDEAVETIRNGIV